VSPQVAGTRVRWHGWRRVQSVIAQVINQVGAYSFDAIMQNILHVDAV
jgi:hypothetical protein